MRPRAGDVAHGEVERLQRACARRSARTSTADIRDAATSFSTIGRRARLVARERRRQVARRRSSALVERERVLERAACRSRSSSGRCAAHRRSAPCCDTTSARSRPGEVAPDRAVGHERVACRVAANTCSQMLAALRPRRPVEAGARPGGRVAFDDEGAHVRRVAIVMRVEGAESLRDERLRQRVEGLVVPYQTNLLARCDSEAPNVGLEACGAPASSRRRRPTIRS